MFRFANPQYLWLLLFVPALVALYWLAARNRRRRLARFGRPGILEELMPEVSTGRMAFRFILFCAAVTLVILAAARPQFGSKLREEKAQGIEMMLTVDVSNSMLAEDFEPNRLERTKYAIGKLFEGLQQDRVGLVVFAGEPKVQLPITSDYRMARAFARRIDPSLVSVQGTAIGKALEQALLDPKQSVKLTQTTKNIMSVNVPVYDFQTQTRSDADIYPYGFAATSGELDTAVDALGKVFRKMLKLAEVEKSAQLMAEEIEKTRRRVNALEYVVIPNTQDAIRYITMKLDENDRATTTRLMKVKDMLLQQSIEEQRQRDAEVLERFREA